MHHHYSSPPLDLEIWASTRTSVIDVLRRAAQLLGQHEAGSRSGCCYAITTASLELGHGGVVSNQADRCFLSTFGYDNELSARCSVYFFGPTWKDTAAVPDEEIEAAYNHRVIALLFLAEMIADEPTQL